MAKIIMNDGMVIEGTAEELAQLAKTFGEGAESSDRVIEGDPKVGDLTTGSIVKITEEAGYDGHYRAELLDGSDYDHAPASSLEKLTEKEVKFAEIGRKVDEYRVGDIVEFNPGSMQTHALAGYSGIFAEISEVDSECVSLVKPPFINSRTGTGTPNHLIELVTPVELRFDK